MISISVYGDFAEKLETVDSRVDATVARSLARIGALLLTQVRANASTGTHAPGEPHIPGTGPGPNVATGDYRRSWGMEADGTSVTVFTRAPQAARLEYGFVGLDAAGRRYNQRPYPHLRPAMEKLRKSFIKELGKDMEEGLL